MRSSFFKLHGQDKRGLSTVVSVVLLTTIGIIAVVIVFGVVKNLITEKIEESEACFGIFDKITINSLYTCYDFNENEFRFAIDLQDIQPDSLVVAIYSGGTSKTLQLTPVNTSIPYLFDYAHRDGVKLPGENSGLTYYYNESGMLMPDTIKISPIIDGTSCGEADSYSDIVSCTLLLS